MPTIITCGVYGFTAEYFEKAIIQAQPDVFVDTRRRRGVRGSQYSFANNQRLQAMLAKNAITYVHNLDLAPSRKAVKREGKLDQQQNIARHDRDALSDEFVAEYTRDVLDNFDPAGFVESLGGVDRVLIFCVERTPAACHRGLLARKITDDLGWDREDLVPPTL